MQSSEHVLADCPERPSNFRPRTGLTSFEVWMTGSTQNFEMRGAYEVERGKTTLKRFVENQHIRRGSVRCACGPKPLLKCKKNKLLALHDPTKPFVRHVHGLITQDTRGCLSFVRPRSWGDDGILSFRQFLWCLTKRWQFWSIIL